LGDLSHEDVLHVLMSSHRLDLALQASRPKIASPTHFEHKLSSRVFFEHRVVVDNRAFARLLLGRIVAPAAAIEELKPQDVVVLAGVLADLARRELSMAQASTGLSGSSAPPPPFLARICPALAAHLLQNLERLQTEELVCALEALSCGLRYQDDYLADRFVEALKPRLVPLFAGIGGTQQERTSQLARSLQALAWQRPVAFVDLLRPVLEELVVRVDADSEFGAWPDEEARLFVQSVVSISISDEACGDSFAWLSELLLHFQRCSRTKTSEPAGTPSPVVESLVLTSAWGMDSIVLGRAREHWLDVRKRSQASQAML